MATELSNKTVLVVEDSPTQALHVKILLEGMGLTVLQAADGHTGLAMARQLRPHVIILDLQMPGLDGLQVCQALKVARETAEIPVIMFTAHDDQETVQKFLELGAVDFIPKDVFADAVMLETLRQMGMIAGDG